jgi:hypothetical protein
LISMPTNGHTPGQENLQDRLKSAEEECGRLREENARLRAMLGIPDLVGDRTDLHSRPDTENSAKASNLSTPEEKITLFRSLFRGREDIYAVRWEGRGGRSGYSPAGIVDWRAIHSVRPEERKRVARKTRMLSCGTDK